MVLGGFSQEDSLRRVLLQTVIGSHESENVMIATILDSQQSGRGDVRRKTLVAQSHRSCMQHAVR